MLTPLKDMFLLFSRPKMTMTTFMSLGLKLIMGFANAHLKKIYSQQRDFHSFSLRLQERHKRGLKFSAGFKYLLSWLSRIVQKTMLPHLMTCTAWPAVKQALINNFGVTQLLSNQNQSFMYIQIFSDKLPRFCWMHYQEAQVWLNV